MHSFSFFKKLKVVDISTVLAGPSVGMFFAELGAKVIKIENPNVPDVTRSWKIAKEKTPEAISAYFSSINWGKEYLKLDFSEAKDRNQFLAIIKDADILISNLKKGDDLKFGIDYRTLTAIHPKLVYGHLSGYGSDIDRAAYDVVLQAETGFMYMNGQVDSPPTKMPVALIDVLAAHQLKEGILSALLERSITGKGAKIEVSLFDAAIASLVNQATNYLMNDNIPQRAGSLHPNISPYGEVFKTTDNQYVVLAIGSSKQFHLLLDYLGLPDLGSDIRFKTNQQRVINRAELYALLQEKIKTLDSVSLLNHAQKHNIPLGLIRNLAQVFELKEAQSLILEEEIEGYLTRRVKSVVFKKGENYNK